MNTKARIHDESGFVLITVLVILVALTAIVSVAQTNARMEQRIDANSAINTQAYYAAEAGAEKLLSAVRGQMNGGLLTLTSLANIDTIPPTIPGYAFTEYDATLDGTFTSRPVTQGPFAGLTSQDRDLVINSSVSGPAGARSTVNLMARVQTIPIFQFGVFYEKDLELTPAPLMNFRGRVHTNADIYADAGTGAYYYEGMTAAGDLHMHKKSSSSWDGLDNFIEMNDGSFVEIIEDTHDFGGDDVPGTLPSAAQDAAFDAHSQATWDHMIQTRASGIDSLSLPIPAGIGPYELIEPCTGAESPELTGLKYACNADIVVRVLGDSVAVEDGSGNPLSLHPNLVQFNVNQFYDDREQSSVAADGGGGSCSGVSATSSNSNRDVIEIDIDRLQLSEYGNGVLYVTADSVGSSGMIADCLRQYVVRVDDGPKLRAPLTVATNLPMYVLGSYNDVVADWQPASLAADAVTLLSDQWNDSDGGEGFTEQTPSNTTVKTAILAGHTETPWVGAPGGGQFENFPRFLEHWGGYTMTIEGSFVSLWLAQKAIGPACCGHFSPPGRNWGFDENFRDPNKLPPLTPVVGQILRVGFVRRY